MIKQGDCPELMKDLPDNSTSATSSQMQVRDNISGDAGFVGREYLFRRGRFALVTHNPPPMDLR